MSLENQTHTKLTNKFNRFFEEIKANSQNIKKNSQAFKDALEEFRKAEEEKVANPQASASGSPSVPSPTSM